MGVWYYYVRISTNQRQKMDRQLNNPDLLAFCDRMKINPLDLLYFSDVGTGSNYERSDFYKMISTAREGDCIIVSSIDRFGRNYIEGRTHFAKLLQKGVRVYALDRPMLESMYAKVDEENNGFNTFIINFLIDWELMNAQEELRRMKDRQRQGIEVAKAKGVEFGRPSARYPNRWNEVYEKWKKKEITAVAAMKELGLKKTTFYKLVNKYENKEKDTE